LNCGPNTLMFIYFWLMHNKQSDTEDWDPYNPDPTIACSQVKAMRDFLGYHLLTQGGRSLSLRWSSSTGSSNNTPTPVDPSILQPYSRKRTPRRSSAV
jgi:hypothetical protein